MIYGVSEKETAHISCTVDSNPKADSFFWTLNTTAGIKYPSLENYPISKNLPVIFAKRNLSLFIDILLFPAKLSKNWEVMIGSAGHSDIPGAMSTDMSGASLLTYKPMSQVL